MTPCRIFQKKMLLPSSGWPNYV